MNNSVEAQIATNASLELAGPALEAMSVPNKPVEPTFEQLGLIPFDSDVWDSWVD